MPDTKQNQTDMQTAGYLLRSARLKAKLTYTQVSLDTKIPVKTLKAIEKSHFSKLPSVAYLQGFIKNYAQVVNLDPQKTIAVFKRDYNNKEKPKNILPKGLAKPLDSTWTPSPKIKTILALLVVILIFLSYLSISFYRLYQPPKLTVSQPDNALTVVSPVLIKGKTDHDAVLTLNGKIINLEPDGSFTTVFKGSQGTHELEFISTSRRNRSTKLFRYIVITD